MVVNPKDLIDAIDKALIPEGVIELMQANYNAPCGFFCDYYDDNDPIYCALCCPGCWIHEARGLLLPRPGFPGTRRPRGFPGTRRPRPRTRSHRRRLLDGLRCAPLHLLGALPRLVQEALDVVGSAYDLRRQLRGITFKRTYSAASWGSCERNTCTAASPASQGAGLGVSCQVVFDDDERNLDEAPEQIAAPALAGLRQWIVDTGSEQDLVDTERAVTLQKRINPASTPINLSTANGSICADRIADFSIERGRHSVCFAEHASCSFCWSKMLGEGVRFRMEKEQCSVFCAT